jgi:hypothetical protein
VLPPDGSKDVGLDEILEREESSAGRYLDHRLSLMPVPVDAPVDPGLERRSGQTQVVCRLRGRVARQDTGILPTVNVDHPAHLFNVPQGAVGIAIRAATVWLLLPTLCREGPPDPPAAPTAVALDIAVSYGLWAIKQESIVLRRSHRKSKSTLAVLAAVLCLVGQLSGAAHDAVERHVTCAEHGEVTHLRHEVRTDAAGDSTSHQTRAVAAATEVDQAGHDHCGVVGCFRRPLPGPMLIVVAAPEPAAPAAPAPAPVLVSQTERILLSAPKIAPPC